MYWLSTSSWVITDARFPHRKTNVDDVDARGIGAHVVTEAMPVNSGAIPDWLQLGNMCYRGIPFQREGKYHVT